MGYRRLAPRFHAFFATDDVTVGFAFARGENADRVFAKVRCSSVASHHLPGTVLTTAPCARMLQASSFIPTPPPPPQFTMDVRAQTVTGWFRHVLGFDGGKAKAGKAHKKRHKKKSRMSVGEPTNAKLGTHVARGPHGSFHLSSLSPEWKEMLVAAGVTEADLADDSTARILKDIIAGSSDASAEALAPLLAAGLESSGPDTDGEVGPEDDDGGGDWEPAPNPEAPAFIKTYNPVFTRSSDGAPAQAIVAPTDAACAVQAAAGSSPPSAADVLAVDAGQDGAAGVRGTGALPHSDGSSSPAVSSAAGPSQDACASGTSQSPRATAAGAAAVPGNATPPQSPRRDDDNAAADAEASANVDAAGSDDKPITMHVSAAVGVSPPPAPAVAGPVSPTFVRSSLPPLTAIAESDADEEPDDTAAGTAAGGSAVPAHGTSEAGQAGGTDVSHTAVSPRGSVPAASPRSPVQSSGSGSGDGGGSGNSSGGNSPPPRQPRAKRSFTRRASLFLQAKMGLSKPKAAEPAPVASPTEAKPGTSPDSDAGVARGGAGAGAGASGANPRGPVPLMKSPGFLSQLAAGKQALKKGRKRGVRRGCEPQPPVVVP